MTVTEEAGPTIKNWADEFDELDSRVMERNLQAVFWRWTRKSGARARLPQGEIPLAEAPSPKEKRCVLAPAER